MFRAALLLAALICVSTCLSAEDKPLTEEQKKRVEELKNLIAEKKTEVATLEAELSKLNASKFAGVKIRPAKVGEEYLKQGPLAFEFREVIVRTLLGGEDNRDWQITIVCVNVSEKTSIETTALAAHLAGVTLTDDTGREYVIRPGFKIKAGDILAPGARLRTQCTIPGLPSAKAKEYTLTFPATKDEPGVAFVFTKDNFGVKK